MKSMKNELITNEKEQKLEPANSNSLQKKTNKK